jgi:hypothetical protein
MLHFKAAHAYSVFSMAAKSERRGEQFVTDSKSNESSLNRAHLLVSRFPLSFLAILLVFQILLR